MAAFVLILIKTQGAKRAHENCMRIFLVQQLCDSVVNILSQSH